MKAISGEAEALTSREEINIKNVDGTGKIWKNMATRISSSLTSEGLQKEYESPTECRCGALRERCLKSGILRVM